MDVLRDLLQLHVFTDPLYDENCYVLRRRDTQRCLVVDPGLQADAALRFLEGPVSTSRCNGALQKLAEGLSWRTPPECTARPAIELGRDSLQGGWVARHHRSAG